MTDAYVEFDASNDHINVELTDGSRYEGVAIDSRITGRHRWSDTEWEGRIDLHLRWADSVAQIIGTYVRYNQLWCEQRAKGIGAWHPMPDHMTGRADEDAERARYLAIHGPMGSGRCCVLSRCDEPYHATFHEGDVGPLELCVDHYDMLAR